VTLEYLSVNFTVSGICCHKNMGPKQGADSCC